MSRNNLFLLPGEAVISINELVCKYVIDEEGLDIDETEKELTNGFDYVSFYFVEDEKEPLYSLINIELGTQDDSARLRLAGLAGQWCSQRSCLSRVDTVVVDGGHADLDAFFLRLQAAVFNCLDKQPVSA